MTSVTEGQPLFTLLTDDEHRFERALDVARAVATTSRPGSTDGASYQPSNT